MNNYTVLPQMLGKGSFGEVYLGLDKSKGKLVAIKTEHKDKHKKNVLKTENTIIRYATSEETLPVGIIRSYFFWEDKEKYYLVTDLLGPSIGALHKICNKSFSLKTILMLADQIINIIQYYHQHNIIHRDIKPDNFLIEYNLPQKNIYLIDFGLSKKYKINGRHIPCSSEASRVGSLRYMSVNCHNCVELSRRDDMYSIGYTILYLFLGELPWQSMMVTKVAKSKRHEYVYNAKKKTTNQELTSKITCFSCQQKKQVCDFSTVMLDYFNYLDTLDFDNEINYNYITKQILLCMKKHDITYDYKWDWNKYYCVSGDI